MRIILSIVLFFTLITAGEKIHDDGVKPAFGVFRSFPEFINNMPGVTDSTLFLEANSKSYDPTDPDYTLLYIRKGREKEYREDIWAFSDGEKIYIKTDGTSLFSRSFRKLNLRKHYSYYTEWYSISPMATGGSMNDPSVHKCNYYVVEMENGGSKALTKPLLRELLRSEDQALYRKFLAEEEGDKKMIEYLELLNKRLSQK